MQVADPPQYLLLDHLPLSDLFDLNTYHNCCIPGQFFVSFWFLSLDDGFIHFHCITYNKYSLVMFQALSFKTMYIIVNEQIRDDTLKHCHWQLK